MLKIITAIFGPLLRIKLLNMHKYIMGCNLIETKINF